MIYTLDFIDISNANFENTIISNAYFSNLQKSFSNDKLKKQTTASYVLLKKMLEKLGVNLDQQNILVNKYGKPYFENLSIFFNISHSKNLCVCAIAPKPIGVDIQIYSAPNAKIQDRYFDSKAQRRMKFAINKTKAFTKCWTELESELKLYSNRRFKQKHLTTFKTVQDNQKQKYIVAISFEK